MNALMAKRRGFDDEEDGWEERLFNESIEGDGLLDDEEELDEEDDWDPSDDEEKDSEEEEEEEEGWEE